MAGLFNRFSLVYASLRQKMAVAFALMSVIPLAICIYLATIYIFPTLSLVCYVSVILVITIIIALLGFRVARDIVAPVVDIALQAKTINKGDLSRDVVVNRKDEIVEIGSALNTLIHRTKELTITDELTGLYNEKFICSRLEEEVKRAILYQRPCSFVIFNIDDLGFCRACKGEASVGESITRVGKILESNVTEVDRVGRLSADEFGIILPEKNKKQASAVADKLRIKVEEAKISGGDKYPRAFVTLSGGLSENPLDGATAEDLINKAKLSLAEAKRRGNNTVVSL